MLAKKAWWIHSAFEETILFTHCMTFYTWEPLSETAFILLKSKGTATSWIFSFASVSWNNHKQSEHPVTSVEYDWFSSQFLFLAQILENSLEKKANSIRYSGRITYPKDLQDDELFTCDSMSQLFCHIQQENKEMKFSEWWAISTGGLEKRGSL